MKCFVPEYGCYYHFICESAMGLYRLLRNHGQLQSRDFEIWYKGRYTAIIQLFSRHPVRLIKGESEVPSDVPAIEHIRPNRHWQWLQLLPLRDYLESFSPPEPQPMGITLVKRVGKRSYTEHDELAEGLKQFGLPVRDVQLEYLSFGQQINLMRNTCLLVGPHGSGETNLIFMPPGATILELYPKGFSDRVFRGLAKAFGHRLVEITSPNPSIIGCQPSPRIQEYLQMNGWPTREQFHAFVPRMELGRVLRDVASFSIDPKIVLERAERLLEGMNV